MDKDFKHSINKLVHTNKNVQVASPGVGLDDEAIKDHFGDKTPLQPVDMMRMLPHLRLRPRSSRPGWVAERARILALQFQN